LRGWGANESEGAAPAPSIGFGDGKCWVGWRLAPSIWGRDARPN
jgi:hypothetical protein